MLLNKTRDVVTFQIVIAAFLLIILVIIVVPFWRVIVTAFTPLDVYTQQGVPFFLSPVEWTTEAFSQLLSHPLFPRSLLNSVIITLGGTAVSLLLTVPMLRALGH